MLLQLQMKVELYCVVECSDITRRPTVEAAQAYAFSSKRMHLRRGDLGILHLPESMRPH